MEKKKITSLAFIVLQFAVILFSLSAVMGKMASENSFLSKNFIIFYALEIVLLGLYAIIWQQVIKKVDISLAYINKATSIFWSMIFAFLFFEELVTIKNILGVIIIFVGIMVVNRND